MVAKALYSHKTQRQQEQLLLMEERSIIARELHDSLAQVLSFLQIQLTLLKHNLKKEERYQKRKALRLFVSLNKPYQMGILNYENYWRPSV